jgi:hypothetical protein
MSTESKPSVLYPAAQLDPREAALCLEIGELTAKLGAKKGVGKISTREFLALSSKLTSLREHLKNLRRTRRAVTPKPAEEAVAKILTAQMQRRFEP